MVINPSEIAWSRVLYIVLLGGGLQWNHVIPVKPTE